MTEKKKNFLYWVCIFILVVVIAFYVIGEEKKPQKVEIVNIQGVTSVK